MFLSERKETFSLSVCVSLAIKRIKNLGTLTLQSFEITYVRIPRAKSFFDRNVIEKVPFFVVKDF